jgi:hypothetical protein
MLRWHVECHSDGLVDAYVDPYIEFTVTLVTQNYQAGTIPPMTSLPEHQFCYSRPPLSNFLLFHSY